MTKKNLVLSFLSIALLFALLIPYKTSAKTDPTVLPEKDGIYSVSGRPDLKVRVFVHKDKGKPTDPGKGGKNPPSTLVCNLEDSDSQATVSATGWKLGSLVTYTINPKSVPGSVGKNNIATITNEAFSNWSQASGGNVVFTRGTDSSATRYSLDGQNLIAWGRTGAGALAITYTWYYPDTGVVAENDTIFNSTYKWSWFPYSGGCADPLSYDAQDILTHELGHWMGLADHYTDDYINATMYGYGSTAELKKDTLTTGDVAGITAIYH